MNAPEESGQSRAKPETSLIPKLETITKENRDELCSDDATFDNVNQAFADGNIAETKREHGTEAGAEKEHHGEIKQGKTFSDKSTQTDTETDACGTSPSATEQHQQQARDMASQTTLCACCAKHADVDGRLLDLEELSQWADNRILEMERKFADKFRSLEIQQNSLKREVKHLRELQLTVMKNLNAAEKRTAQLEQNYCRRRRRRDR